MQEFYQNTSLRTFGWSQLIIRLMVHKLRLYHLTIDPQVVRVALITRHASVWALFL